MTIMLAECPALWLEISVVSQSSLHQTIIKARKRVAARVATTKTGQSKMPTKQRPQTSQAPREEMRQPTTMVRTSQMLMVTATSWRNSSLKATIVHQVPLQWLPSANLPATIINTTIVAKVVELLSSTVKMCSSTTLASISTKTMIERSNVKFATIKLREIKRVDIARSYKTGFKENKHVTEPPSASLSEQNNAKRIVNAS